jgi:hypothetical protein
MTPNPHLPGESRGSVFGRTLFLIFAAAFVVAVLCLATYVADRIGSSL